MSVIFAGGRLDALAVISGTPTEVTTAGSFNSAEADASLRCLSGDVMEAVFRNVSMVATDVVTGETLFANFDFYRTSFASGGGVNFATLYDSSGYPWLAVRSITATNIDFGLFYNSGTGASPVWTQIGATQDVISSTLYVITIKLTLGSPHTVQLSVNNSLVISSTFTQASLTSLRSLRLNGLTAATYYLHFSRVLCLRNESTINAKLITRRATGAGTHTAWTGVFGDVAEAINSDGTTNSATTAGLKQSYAMADVAVPAGFAFAGVWLWNRAKNDGAAPNNIKSLLRSGGVDYSSANLTGIGTSFTPIGMRYDTDPATGAAFTQAGFNAYEMGYESAT